MRQGQAKESRLQGPHRTGTDQTVVGSTSETPSTNSFLALLQELNSKKEKAEEMIQFLPEFGPHTHLKWGVPAAPVLRRQRPEDSRGL